MHPSQLRLLSLLLLICLVLSGCRPAATAVPAPTEAPLPDLALDGTWVGKTDQDQVVLFVITGSKLTQFKLNYAFETCTKNVFNLPPTQPGVGRYSGHTLSIELPQKLAISFLSDSSAQGTFDFDTSLGLLSASCQPGLKQTIQFSATKQLRQEPTP